MYPKNRKKAELSEKQLAALERGRLKLKLEAEAFYSTAPTIELQWLPGHTKPTLLEADRPKCSKCGQLCRRFFCKNPKRFRFRCKSCKLTFYAWIKITQAPRPKIVCHRCGTPSDPSGRGKASGYCPTCKKQFTRGGRAHLDATYSLLLQRIRDMRLPPDVEAYATAEAVAKVLAGHAYTWDVEVKKRQCFEAVRGAFVESGSEHPVYRAAMGVFPGKRPGA